VPDLAADHQQGAGGGRHFVDLAPAVLVPVAGHDLLTGRLPHQPRQRVHAELPGSRPSLRSGHGIIMTAATRMRTTLFPAAAGKYNCPLLRDDLPWIYDDMAAAETSRVLQPGLAA